MLWLWCSPVVVAWEFPYATGAALKVKKKKKKKKGRKKKKKKKKERKKEKKNISILSAQLFFP